MGCCYSRIEREEIVSRCKARRRYMKQLVKARQAFSAAHGTYLRALRSTGSALLQFADAETSLRNHLPSLLPSPLPPPLSPLPPPPPPPLSTSSDNWTSVTASPALPPPPPPPPPSSSWDFWDPFMPSASRSATEEEWEATTTSEVAVTTVGAASLAAPPSVVSGFSKDTTVSDLPLVVSRNSKELVEIIKELDEYFLKAADAGSHLSFLLEVPTCNFPNQKTPGKVYNYGRSLSPLVWTSFGKTDEEIAGGSFASSSSHCSTVDKLYAWEKKLYLEVKNAEGLKIEHEKRVVQLRKLEVNRAADYLKTEKLRKEVEKLESRTMVASQAIETTSAEIIKLRETEFYPQLLELVRGLMGMWRGMYQCHQVQTHIVQQLKFLNTILSTDPTSEIHRQSTLQLELEVNQWHQSFCNLVKAQLDYIQSLTGWLRLSLFQFNKTPLPKTHNDSPLYSLCEEWHHAIDRVPDKVASEGIKSFLTVIHAIVAQQAEEYKQKKRSDYAFKVFEKKMGQLRSLESKYGGPMALTRNNRDPIGEKRLKVEILRRKAEEEKNKYEKAVSVTRAMTINNLQMGFPHVFEAVTGFSSVCMHAFESVYNQAKISREDQHDVKRILP